MIGRRLHLGQWIAFDDDEHQIVGFIDTAVRLRSRGGHTQLITTAALLADPTFDDHHAAADQEPEPTTANTSGEDATSFIGCDTGGLWEDLSDADRHAALKLEAHLLEVLTGYRSGEPDPARQPEPRPEYAPQRPLQQRVDAKAEELHLSSRRVWQLIRGYREYGVFDLVDKRKLHGTNPLGSLDSRIIDAVLDQAVYEESDSTGTFKRFYRRVQNRLDATYGPGAVTLPSERTMRRLTADLLVGRYTFGLATTRRTTANQPDRPFGHVIAHRPGEIVMIDTSWLDVYAYDPVVDEDISCEITVALDLYSRSVLGWRITPLGTKGIDIGLIVADAMTPEPMRPGWPETLRYSLMPVATSAVMSLDERLAAAAARPVIYPETLLVDHGRPYESDVVRRACTRLGINFPHARKGKPTDKPEVEAVFRTIRLQFSEHIAGYKGPDIARRGRDPQGRARWTISELEEFFAEYIVAVYQRSWHEGLTVPGYPNERLSPNQAYELGVARAGYVSCPSDPDLYFELMPIAWRQIHPAGVQIGYLTYCADVLYRYRNVESPYQNHGRRWPIRYDPRDMLHAYFRDPQDGKWCSLRWIHALDEIQPFTENTLHEVTALIANRPQRSAEQADIAAALIDLQNRMDAPEAWTTHDRKRAARDAERARAAARDHHRALTQIAHGADNDAPPPLHAVPDNATAEVDFVDPDTDLDLGDITPADTWHPSDRDST